MNNKIVNVFLREPRLVLLAAVLVLGLQQTGSVTSAQNGKGEMPSNEASSVTSSLFTITGSGAATDFGDYVSSSAALNTYYSYFIEVPPNLNRLSVDIFDADVGAGGSGEASAGRDRARGSFNSAAQYSLRDPSGAIRPVMFTHGDSSGPAGADNAWLTFFDGTGRSVADNFSTASYGNNDGTDNFSGNWIESDAGGAGPSAGAVRVTGGELRIQDDVSGVASIERQVNLSGTGLSFSNAFFSFDYRTSGNLEDGDEIVVEVSGNGGSNWSTLESFSNDSSGTRSYNIAQHISNNTRVRFRVTEGYTGSEYFYVDNLEINDGGPITAGHWEVRVDMSSAVTTGDDINAVGIRAHDGTPGAGGTELNTYVAGNVSIGVNAPASGTQSRSYTLYPYVTSGCTYATNDFDYDSNSGNVGSMTFTSPSGGYSQNLASAALSGNDVWTRNNVTGWTSDTGTGEYGIWTADILIGSYLVSGVPNGNYVDLYLSSFAAAANPPTTNASTNKFRTYIPTDAGTAPLKPYLTQSYTQVSGPNPVPVGQTGTMRIRVAFINPTAHPVTFSSPSNRITANVPGGGVVYAGNTTASQGTVDSQPAIGGSGNVIWNPGTIGAGGTAFLTYAVNATPSSEGQRLPITAAPASGNGTRAQYVDETGNTSQSRATMLFGPLCDIALTEGGFNLETTSAGVSIGGRVRTAEGAGLRNAVVTLVSVDGRVRTAVTGQLGYYQFDGVKVGTTYALTVASKRYAFESRALMVDDSLADVDFTANRVVARRR